ncbi:LPXTG cell wall anchor domain-containing protein [Occultella gossypii]|uniref:LPXTG cell wall anchor domain-containing protein n=1 Tax=Occultella gossypii TaxID=2800820 RepID=A0ABS7SBG4_9MICO|nr:LPXTG cell wall anchor domain-containing protein [Occultella gossypii]MBZ2197080.1 LPXTG cell wall anchor domain-containing protein [Occultella gossypii]
MTSVEVVKALVTVTNAFDPVPVPVEPGDSGQAVPGIPVTGADAGWLAAVSALLIAAGALVLVRRRRSSH